MSPVQAPLPLPNDYKTGLYIAAVLILVHLKCFATTQEILRLQIAAFHLEMLMKEKASLRCGRMMTKTREGWQRGELNQRPFPPVSCFNLPCQTLPACQKPGLMVFFVTLKSQSSVCSFNCAGTLFLLWVNPGEVGWQELQWQLRCDQTLLPTAVSIKSC